MMATDCCMVQVVPLQTSACQIAMLYNGLCIDLSVHWALSHISLAVTKEVLGDHRRQFVAILASHDELSGFLVWEFGR